MMDFAFHYRDTEELSFREESSCKLSGEYRSRTDDLFHAMEAL